MLTRATRDLFTQIVDESISPRRVFTFLIVYRWLSLIPPLVSLLLTDQKFLALVVLSTAIGISTLISLFSQQLNRALRTRPWLLAFDLFLMAGLVTLSGGWRSPYYLHVLNPLLAAAFFFQWRGAALATTGFLPFYMTAVLTVTDFGHDATDWLAIITAVVGFYLISGAFGFAADLVTRLRAARDSLADAHRDLEVVHDLAVSLQGAVYVEDVQERVLEAITVDLGFTWAVVGLVDQEEGIFTNWLGRIDKATEIPADELAFLDRLPFSFGGGPGAEDLIVQQVRQAVSNFGEGDGKIYAGMMGTCHIFPMLLRNHPVGVLLVGEAENNQELTLLKSLGSIASQAAVAIGTTMLCIYRAQELAVQDERLRIAQDIHDTVSQSLFGIVYTIDGCLKLLPEQVDVVIPELERVKRVAQTTHDEVRNSILDIWPSEMMAEQFRDGLLQYAADISREAAPQLVIDVHGAFDHLSVQARRGLYRIAQEALANAIQHAAASQIGICLEVTAKQSRLTIQDNGNGFDPNGALLDADERKHFGLRGMKERALSLGGTCDIESPFGVGSSIVVDIPLLNRNGNG